MKIENYKKRIADEKIVAINKKSNKVHNNMFLLLFEWKKDVNRFMVKPPYLKCMLFSVKRYII